MIKLRLTGAACLALAALSICLFCFGLQAIAQTAANASVPSTIVDIGPLVSQFLEPLLMAIAGVLGTWLVTKIVGVLGLQNNTALVSTLETAMQNGLAFAQSRLDAKIAAGPLTLDVKNQIIATATNYTTSHVPDTLKALGVDPATLIQKIEARLSLNTMPAAESIAVPTDPSTVMRSHWLTVLAALVLMVSPLLGGCQIDGQQPSTQSPSPSAQSYANAIGTGYALAKAGFALYATLPDCGAASAGTLCKEPAAVAAVTQAVIVADPLIAKAQADIIAAPNQTTMQTAMQAGQDALQVFMLALQTYGIKTTPAAT